jgi:hypothetical protein
MECSYSERKAGLYAECRLHPGSWLSDTTEVP